MVSTRLEMKAAYALLVSTVLSVLIAVVLLGLAWIGFSPQWDGGLVGALFGLNGLFLMGTEKRARSADARKIQAYAGLGLLALLPLTLLLIVS